VTEVTLRRDLEGVLDRLRASSSVRDVLVVVGLSILLGTIRLSSPSLWVDEAFTARAVHLSLADLMTGQLHWLYYSIERPWTAVFGTSEIALRFPSVLGAAVASGLLVVVGRKLFDRRVAVVSGALLAVNPFVVKWSQQARGYTLLLGLSLVALILLLRALERSSRRAWVEYGVVFAAVFVWHPVSGLVLVPAHALLVYQRRERFLPHGLVAGVPILALAAPWVAQIALRTSGEDSGTAWLTFPTAGTTGRAVLDISGIAGVGVVLGIAGIVSLRHMGRTDLAVWLGVWAATPFVVALVVSLLRPVFLDRYLIVAAPAFALLGGVVLVRMAARLRLALLVIVIAATGLALFYWYSPRDDGNWRGEDWRSAVREVQARRTSGTPIVVAPYWAHAAPEYYGADVSGVATASSIWVLTWSEAGGDLSRAERRTLGFGDHRLVERLDFGSRVSAQLWKRGP
jgi:mannosyltransferase